MNRRGVLWVLGAAAVGLALLAGFGVWAQGAKPADPPKTQKARGASDTRTEAAPTKSLQKPLEDQRAVLKEMHRLHGTVGLVSPSPSYDVESEYLWSRRLLAVERVLGNKKDDQITALRGHLGRMQRLEDRVQKLVKSNVLSELDTLAARFYVLEAEYWLEQAKALSTQSPADQAAPEKSK